MTDPNELQGQDPPTTFKAGWVPGETSVVEVMEKANHSPSLGTHPASHKTKKLLKRKSYTETFSQFIPYSQKD